MANLSDKLNVKIDWDKILIYSVISIVVAGVLGLLLKIRLFLAFAEVGLGLVLVASIIVFVTSIIHKYTTK